jgi:hypothetical protein
MERNMRINCFIRNGRTRTTSTKRGEAFCSKTCRELRLEHSWNVTEGDLVRVFIIGMILKGSVVSTAVVKESNQDHAPRLQDYGQHSLDKKQNTTSFSLLCYALVSFLISCCEPPPGFVPWLP